ncbi:MAG: PcfJ domain-containing protein [Bacteroidales bacterium]|nr:PcfJ domain-containing protein [Bacteroidales bacterium]
MSGYQSPSRSSLVFNAELGKIYRFNKTSVRLIRLGSPFPAAFIKHKQTNSWQNYIPGSCFPFIFKKPSEKCLTSEIDASQKYALYRRNLLTSIVNHIGIHRHLLLERFNNRHWFLYCLSFHGGEYAMEFMDSNPALAYLLSAHGVFHPLKSHKYWRSARSLLKQKRKDILGYFGFPSSEAMVSIFAKIAPDSCNQDSLLYLRKCLQERHDLLTKLSHYPSHNHVSLWIFCSRADELLHYNVMLKLCMTNTSEDQMSGIYKIQDIQRMRHTISQQGLHVNPILIRSLREIDDIHDELVQAMNAMVKANDIRFRESPLRDVKSDLLWIESIKCSSELHWEGVQMHHCIFSYTDLIAHGSYFVARMLVPQRLTILYAYSDQGQRNLYLVDARGLYNEPTSKRAKALIELWLQGLDFQAENSEQLTIFDGSDFEDYCFDVSGTY